MNSMMECYYPTTCRYHVEYLRNVFLAGTWLVVSANGDQSNVLYPSIN